MRGQQLFQSRAGTAPQDFVDNTQGLYYYRREGACVVKADRNVLSITSAVLAGDAAFDVELPAHPAFYVLGIGPGETKKFLIEKDLPLKVVLTQGYQLMGMCPLGG